MKKRNNLKLHSFIFAIRWQTVPNAALTYFHLLKFFAECVCQNFLLTFPEDTEQLQHSLGRVFFGQLMNVSPMFTLISVSITS